MKKFFIFFIILLINLNIFSNELFEKNSGIILGSGVRIFDKPSESSKFLNVLQPFSVVKILKWEEKKEKIRNFEDKWVYIQTSDGLKGYIFGAFIFELDSIYSKKWEQTTKITLAKTIYTFNKDKTFTLESYIKKEDKVIKTVYDGKFSITSRGIKLTGDKINGELFFFRYKGKNALSSLMFTPDDNVPFDFLYF